MSSCSAVWSFTSFRSSSWTRTRSSAWPWSRLFRLSALSSLLIKDRGLLLSRWWLGLVNYLFVYILWLLNYILWFLNNLILRLDLLMKNFWLFYNMGGFGRIINLLTSLISKLISLGIPHFAFNIFEFFSLHEHIFENFMTVLNLLMRKSESFASDQTLDSV